MRRGDLVEADFRAACRFRQVAWDIETSGLDWEHERIGTTQLLIPNRGIVIVQVAGCRERPELLSRLLEDQSVQKVFHFALFDLTFMVRHWGVDPKNIACTKVASRILNPEGPHSLQDLLAGHLAITLNKSQSAVRTSDWERQTLLTRQIDYAADDVRYLLMLYDKLVRELVRANLLPLAQSCFAFLPHRVQLELHRTADPFRY